MRQRYLRVLDSKGRKIPVVAVKGNAYEGATFGRRLTTWGTTIYGPNTELFSSLSTLRARSRELVRNNAYARGLLETLTSNLISRGITPRWQVEDEQLKKEIQNLWADWIHDADADGRYGFYGLQVLITRSMIESGEVFVRLRPRRQSDGLKVPLQLQVIEADHLDETYSTTRDNGNQIRMGIELNKIGKRVAYWLYREHPGETFSFGGTGERARIPASQILHIYYAGRPGQLRGCPWLSSIILKMRELDQYDDAELVRKKTTAMFGGFIIEPPGESDQISPLGAVVGEDSSGREIVALEPGTFSVLPPGMDVRFAEPADVGGSYEAWMKQQLRMIARGTGVTYEQLTGDLEKVNYSSIRAGLLEFRRWCRMIQDMVIIPQLCQAVAEIWIEIAVLSGALQIPDYWENKRKYQRIAWHPDGWEWVDPLKDQMAELIAVRAGFKSRAQVIAESGRDIETVDAEIAEDNKRADELGLIFDSDPRKTAKSGSLQNAEDLAMQETITGGR